MYWYPFFPTIKVFFYRHNIYSRLFCSKWIFFTGSTFSRTFPDSVKFQDISWFCQIPGSLDRKHIHVMSNISMSCQTYLFVDTNFTIESISWIWFRFALFSVGDGDLWELWLRGNSQNTGISQIQTHTWEVSNTLF